MEDREIQIAAALARVAAAVTAVQAIEERLDTLRKAWGSGYSPTLGDQEAEMAASDEQRAAEARLAALQDAR